MASFADACGEVPLPEIVAFGLNRLRAISYLARFGAHLRQLGLTQDEVISLQTATVEQTARLAAVAGARAGWLADPEAHLRVSGCTLMAVVGEDAGSTIDIPFLDQEALLERFASLQHDVRLWIGIDPHRPGSVDTALALLQHPRACGAALSPFMAGTELDSEPYATVLRALADRNVPIWVHCSAHFDPRVSYDIGHPRHIDAALRRHPGLRLVIGHAGWPWTDEACIVAIRHPSVALEFSTFPPSLLPQPGWSLTPLLAQRGALTGRIFFGSGGVSAPKRLLRLLAQLEALDLGDDLPAWRGAGLRRWLRLDA
ncbi:MAG: amidohydrolase family protein [Acetobacteraceae bacterium]|nr:amidohydrolase family protein [Acetobacteraceae bacterium]